MTSLSDETKQKINSKDINNSIETNIMINPQPLSEPSPTLPDKFPNTLIPKDLCEYEVLELINCMLHNKFDNILCENFQLNYYNCKRKRDATLFRRVKEWECDYFRNLEEENRIQYIKDLVNIKKNKLEEYEQTEIDSNTIGFRKRIDSDIMQLNWRINYLPHCLI